MKPEQLLVLASARGISLDLGRPRDIPLAHRRRAKDGETALGRQTPGRGPRAWTPSDLGLAAAGMPPELWNALCWSIGLDEQSRTYLKNKLFDYAVYLKHRESWPKQVSRGFCAACGMLRAEKYVEDLCVMAVTEMAHPQLYGTEIVRAQMFGMTERSWGRQLSKPYQAVYGRIQNWYLGGLAHLREKLREHENFAHEPA